MGMDPFEDFEMKPITRGLGFHKKPIDLKQSVEASGITSELSPSLPPEAPTVEFLNNDLNFEENGQSLEDLMAALTSPKELAGEAAQKAVEFEITMPLAGRENRSIDESLEVLKDTGVDPSIISEIPNISEITNIQKSEKLFDLDAELNGVGVGARRGSSDSPLADLKPSPICLSSLFLDALVVLSLSMIFLSSLLMVTKVSLMSVVSSISTDATIQISAAVLFLAVYQMYAIVSRVFFGRTLGEWTFDHQMGDSDLQESGWYPLLVVWRSAVIVCTGVVLLPLLSFVFRKDLAAVLSGLQLYKHR